jgi:hypothetical protein
LWNLIKKIIKEDVKERTGAKMELNLTLVVTIGDYGKSNKTPENKKSNLVKTNKEVDKVVF